MNENTIALYHWYQSPPGREFSQCAQSQLDQFFSKTFGYYLIQCGLPEMPNWLKSAPIQRHFALGEDIHWSGEKFPLQNESIDCLYLAHALEHIATPHLLLNEARRILVPGGRLIIQGFNPWSTFGLKRYLKDTLTPPWFGQWQGCGALNKLLDTRSFRVLSQQTTCNRSLIFTMAEKRSRQILPIKPPWRIRDYLINPIIPAKEAE